MHIEMKGDTDSTPQNVFYTCRLQRFPASKPVFVPWYFLRKLLKEKKRKNQHGNPRRLKEQENRG